jgi:sugar lactone lactonase YvrE
VLAVLGVVLVLSSCNLSPRACTRLEPVAAGFANPRGLAIGADGTIAVAESGNEDLGGRVSIVRPNGQIVRVRSGLPHSVNAGVEDVGPSGVAYRRGALYVANGEASGELASKIYRLDPDGQATVTADPHAFEWRFDPDGDLPESNPFALVYDPSADLFYMTDAAANSLLRIQPDGRIDLLAVWHDGVVPTGLVLGPDRALYVTLFGRFPHPPEAGRIDRVQVRSDASPSPVETIATELSMPIGLAFDRQGDMLVVEFASRMETLPSIRFRPDSGRVVRVTRTGRETVVDRLPFPTAILADPNGGYLIALGGAMSAAETGRIARLYPCSPLVAR